MRGAVEPRCYVAKEECCALRTAQHSVTGVERNDRCLGSHVTSRRGVSSADRDPLAAKMTRAVMEWTLC